MLKENLERVKARIVQAAKAVGRDPASIRLIAVTKGVPVERIQEAIACGVSEIGENRVQEAQGKKPLVEKGDRHLASLGASPLRWHMVGTLQRNKAKFAVEVFDAIHSLDSMELIETLDRQAVRKAQGGRSLEGLIQVNVSGEATKHGCRPEETKRLAEAILKSKHLKLTGLMTMAPISENPETARRFFRQLRQLRDQLQSEVGFPLGLSMGMSQDFEVAVEEGATLVRIGTAIFGGANFRGENTRGI